MHNTLSQNGERADKFSKFSQKTFYFFKFISLKKTFSIDP